MSSEIQHQLNDGMSLTAGYYRNWYGNFSVTDNLAVAPADYGTYCITAPPDPRLPGGGGYQVCGLADVSLAKFGLVNNQVTQAVEFRQAAPGQQLLQRQPEHAVRVGDAAGRRRRHRPLGDRQLLRRRFTAAARELQGHHAVQGADAGQVQRQLSAPVRVHRQRHSAEHLGSRDHRELRGDERGNCAVARPQPGGMRHQDAVHVDRHCPADRPRHTVRRADDAAGSARDEDGHG